MNKILRLAITTVFLIFLASNVSFAQVQHKPGSGGWKPQTRQQQMINKNSVDKSTGSVCTSRQFRQACSCASK